MHQTFYIDIDEEISSVIDRLNKSMAEDNYFVVPARAIFLQSIVNLKLLRREADKAGKQVILVTQDKVGMSMAHRAGIEIRPTLEGLEILPGAYPEDFSQNEPLRIEQDLDEPRKKTKKIPNKQARLNHLGSSDFYESAPASVEKQAEIMPAKRIARKIPINSGRMITPAKRKIVAENYVDDLRVKTAPAEVYKKNHPVQEVYRKEKISSSGNIFRENISHEGWMDDRKEKTLEKMFLFTKKQPKPSVENAKNDFKNKEVRGKKVFLIFALLSLFALTLVAAYLLLPNSKITIIPNVLINKIDVNAHASGSAPADALNIPVRTIDKTQDISVTYKVEGKSASSGKKAHGSVVIYNEYNSSSQTLIATTRLESPDGKIFRLTKNITVPGTTMVGGSLQPGAIEAEIIADQPGGDSNIDPTRFTVPGFSGSPKFDKFYAKSSAPMTGGSSEGDSGIATVSQQDIDSAKAKTEAALRDAIDKTIQNELQSGEMSLSQAEKMTIIRSVTPVKVGDVTDSLVYTVQASVRALIFSENDVKNIIMRSSNNTEQTQDTRQEISKIEYVSIDPDFDAQSMDLKIRGEVTIIPNIDGQQIKKELLGKNSDQVAEVLKKYPSIKNINLEFWPTFISHISQYSSRVSVDIVISE